MNNKNTSREKRLRRHGRVRSKINGTAKIPRVSVFRSNKHLFVQIIDDDKRKTLLSNKIASDKKTKGGKTELASAIGEELAKKAKEAKINEVVFDRAGYKYHGRVKALAEGLRKGGLKF
ncbi:MAG: 50S ribosomal protein L18 [Candidatus Yanofskybacteria bacterium CG10_big_fil_rev_8_21_14_0_10_36_16]|uniref:Large ribosomal subunit protein uL18 n=1 Tax=Candidatus Yanofskybacteria bacterium CG10_big_fil_rev_8_21_14_0_10_36_16 TaxID=1975096 RepID=A0A2J0Q889_9BACT|nr:MAG: 50S ribosomal protein L18 [Candidatus Yanofskybacteria bacterium CG10_big_fil_rev_8_21_14_0_10_36_16]